MVQTVQAGTLSVVVRSPDGSLHLGRNVFTIEFHSPDGTLVNVGTLRANANMRMPGMVMSSGMEVRRTTAPGRYEASAEFGMAGAWPVTLEWDGPAGQGSVSFQGAVQ